MIKNKFALNYNCNVTTNSIFSFNFFSHNFFFHIDDFFLAIKNSFLYENRFYIIRW